MPLLSNFASHEVDMEPILKEDPEETVCPVCGNSPEWLYVDEWGEVVGCSVCLRIEYVEEP